MLRHLLHKEIDTARWDSCVAASPQRIVYAYSWYLNAVCSHWEALVEEKEGAYVSVFPVPVKVRLGQKLAYQPFFTQQLGLFTTAASTHTSLPAYLSLLQKHYQKLYLHLNIFNTAEAVGGALTVRERITYHLHLDRLHEQLRKGYTTSHRRNVKKALAKELVVEESDDFEALVRVFRQTKGKEVRELKTGDYARLLQLCQVLKANRAALLLVVRQGQELLCGGLFLVQPEKVIYMFGAATEAARKTGAMTLLLDELIGRYSGSGCVLDFEGSNIESIAKFYAGFGAHPVRYISLNYNFLTWYLRWISR